MACGHARAPLSAAYYRHVKRHKMHIPELAPLLGKIHPLRENAATREIAIFVEGLVERANTPSMGQSVCDEIITMCHPKGWGDRHVRGFGSDWAA